MPIVYHIWNDRSRKNWNFFSARRIPSSRPPEAGFHPLGTAPVMLSERKPILRGEDLAEAVHSLPQRAHAAFTLHTADA